MEGSDFSTPYVIQHSVFFEEKKKLIRFQTVVTGILVPIVVLYFDIVVKVSSVIRPKDESQDGGNKKSKYVKFSEKK